MNPNPYKRPIQWTPFTEVPPANSEGEGQTFINSLYQVTLHHQRSSGYTWLSIVRRDRRPVHDWRHLQRIKNELCGPDREAVEIYPCEARLVDTSNQYHLWVLPLGETVNLGFAERDVSETVVGAHKQRPFDVPPPDLGRPTSVGLRTPVLFPSARPTRRLVSDALLAEAVKLARKTGVSEETMLDQLGLTGGHRQHIHHLANPAQSVKGDAR